MHLTIIEMVISLLNPNIISLYKRLFTNNFTIEANNSKTVTDSQTEEIPNITGFYKRFCTSRVKFEEMGMNNMTDTQTDSQSEKIRKTDTEY